MTHQTSAVATPVPTGPSAGAPSLPYMNTQLPNTLVTRPRSATYIIGCVRPMPSLTKRSTWKPTIAGMPKAIACT